MPPLPASMTPTAHNIVTSSALANIRSDTDFRQLKMQNHEYATFEDDADVFNFLTVAFGPYAPLSPGFLAMQMSSSDDSVTPENDELSPLLATPVAPLPAHDTTRIESPYATLTSSLSPSPTRLHSGFNTYEFGGVLETPGAPAMKDFDCFTEGTGAGSFADFVDEDDANELALGALVAHPEPYNPNTISIMAWIEDVRITHQSSQPNAESNAPWVGYADLPEDPLHMEALEATEAMLEDFNIDVEAVSEESGDMNGDDNGDGDGDVSVSVGDSVDPRIPSPINLIPPMSAPPTAMTPRVMKRARSRSASQNSRRVRSRSLSSIHGLPRDLTTLPPWRSTRPFKDK
ncbi:hypothetical protein C0995_003501 [Termitomyces sp. Mi166|nr:hypothetical protein C0995_003501 [Termitomyces sp. Mi166\